MVDRVNAPLAGQITKFSFPDFQKSILSNGIALAVLRRDAQPVIFVEIIIPVGRADDPIPGLSHYTARMLPESTQSRNSSDIASQIDFYGGHLEIIPALDYVTIKLYAIKRFFKELFAILIDVLSNPVFPPAEFDKLKRIRIEQIKQQLAKNNMVASLALRECLFGPDHPYGIQIGVKEAAGVEVAQVADFYRFHFLKTPRVYVAGDVGDGEMAILEKALLEIPFLNPNGSVFPLITPQPGITIEKEGSMQSSLRMGKLVEGRQHPDVFSLEITNELLGGFFGSRLMKNIREEKGLTYGIHSSVVHLQHFSYWQIGTDVLKEKREEAIDEILKEIRKLQNEAPDHEEMLTLKSYMKGKLLTSFDTVFHAVEMFKTTDLAGLPITYWSELFEAIDGVSPGQISETANKHFDREEIRNVVVG